MQARENMTSHFAPEKLYFPPPHYLAGFEGTGPSVEHGHIPFSGSYGMPFKTKRTTVYDSGMTRMDSASLSDATPVSDTPRVPVPNK
ncbi:hypothetical protein FPOAC2_07988 [Fusarium poae]|jgi:hypothetical protein